MPAPLATPAAPEDASPAMLIGVIALVGIVIAVGWYNLIAPSLFENFQFLSIPLAMGIAALAIVAARTVASEVIRVRKDSDAPNRHTWIVFLLLLFGLSALGTLNTAIYYGEGPAVLRESLETASSSLTRLQARSTSLLATPNFDAKKKIVDDLMTNLEKEALHDANCGLGDKSRQHMAALKRELPGFVELTGKPNCKTTEGKRQLASTLASYREQTQRLLRNSVEYRLDRVGDVERIQAAMRATLPPLMERIEAAKRGITGVESEASGAGPSGGARTEARQALVGAARDYGSLLNQFKEHHPPGAALPALPASSDTAAPQRANYDDLAAAIPIAAAVGLGSISQVAPLLVERLSTPGARLRTCGYIAFALLLDLLLVVAFKLAMTRGPEAPARPANRSFTATDDDLHFLWVSP